MRRLETLSGVAALTVAAANRSSIVETVIMATLCLEELSQSTRKTENRDQSEKRAKRKVARRKETRIEKIVIAGP
jgi:hypothetical protein